MGFWMCSFEQIKVFDVNFESISYYGVKYIR